PLGSLANASFAVSHGLTMVWLFVGISAAGTLWILLTRENARRDALVANQESKAELSAEERFKLGDKRPDWRYHV
ncbi:hypothetical protein HK405_001701, partial [Cladochytrium tenue]